LLPGAFLFGVSFHVALKHLLLQLASSAWQVFVLLYSRTFVYFFQIYSATSGVLWHKGTTTLSTCPMNKVDIVQAIASIYQVCDCCTTVLAVDSMQGFFLYLQQCLSHVTL